MLDKENKLFFILLIVGPGLSCLSHLDVKTVLDFMTNTYSFYSTDSVAFISLSKLK